MGMKRILFVRHGQTGVQNRYLGRSDVGLNEAGRKQVAQLSHALAMKDVDAVFSSPMLRCRQTCEILLTARNAGKVYNDGRLIEIDFGRWEGKTFKEILPVDREMVDRWSQGGPSFQFPEGEKMADFYNRIDSFAAHLYSTAGERFLVITHGGVIRHLICRLLHLDFANYLYFRVDYGKLCSIDLYSEGGVLTGLNMRGDNG